MNVYNKSFDRKLRCDDIIGAQPKIRHYEKKIVRNYPNQMMASISNDEEQNIRQYMNEKLMQDEQKYNTYRNVVDYKQKIGQAFQNSQIFDKTSSRKNLKAMHQSISKNVLKNELQLMQIIDHTNPEMINLSESKQINQNSYLQNNINQPETLNQKNENTDLSCSKIICTPPKIMNRYVDQQKDFYQLENNVGNFSGLKVTQNLSKQDILLPTSRINSRLMNNRNGQSLPVNQYIVDGNGSQLLRDVYGDIIYQKNISRSRMSQSGERNGLTNNNRSYQLDNDNEKNKFISINKSFAQGQNEPDKNIFIQNQSNDQQTLPLQSFNLQQELAQRQQNLKQRQRILSYNIITNNSFNYVYDKLPKQNEQLPQINPQIQNNHSTSVDRINQNYKQQLNPSNNNVQFRVNNIPLEYQLYQQNTFQPESFTERRIQFNRKKQLIY